MSGTAFLFLNGSYHTNDRALVKRLLRQTRPRPLLMAIDGGLTFLQKCDLSPDIWLTDLDSTPRIKKGFIDQTTIFLYPPQKNKTDGELALDLCRQKKIREATIFGWYDRTHETDHLMGNLLLSRCAAVAGGRLRLRFLDSRQEIYPLVNAAMRLTSCTGRRLSVVPLSAAIRLTLAGTEYAARALPVKAGQTIALRNRISAATARIRVEGAALVIVGTK